MKDRGPTHPLWTVPTPVTDLPDTGRRIELVAGEAVRMTIAAAAGVSSIDRLEATFELTRDGRDGVRATGRVSATVLQLCVVTLEPLQSEVDEAIDLVFSPPAEAPAKTVGGASAREVSGTATDEPPEAIRDGAIDLGAVAAEFLILGIDPYPRKPGAAFDPPPAPQDPASHPFAALAALKKN